MEKVNRQMTQWEETFVIHVTELHSHPRKSCYKPVIKRQELNF